MLMFRDNPAKSSQGTWGAESFDVSASEASLLRLVGTALMELREEWKMGKSYLNMDMENDDSASKQKKIHRKKVACSFYQLTAYLLPPKVAKEKCGLIS